MENESKAKAVSKRLSENAANVAKYVAVISKHFEFEFGVNENKEGAEETLKTLNVCLSKKSFNEFEKSKEVKKYKKPKNSHLKEMFEAMINLKSLYSIFQDNDAVFGDLKEKMSATQHLIDNDGFASDASTDVESSYETTQELVRQLSLEMSPEDYDLEDEEIAAINQVSASSSSSSSHDAGKEGDGAEAESFKFTLKRTGSSVSFASGAQVDKSGKNKARG